ncbi:MAG: coenzyme F420 hydrogenase subunit alpha [Halobacteriota archaeon]
MANVVEMAPVTRVEGHSKLVLETNDDGIVEKGNYFSITPVRNFEKFLIGKPMEFAPLATSRICGICPVTHSCASVEAVEDSIGVEPPKDGMLLRELAGIANRMHSHPLHSILIFQDYGCGVGFDANVYTEAMKRCQGMRKIAQNIIDVVGGEGLHAPDIVIGGMQHNISDVAKNKLMSSLRTYEALAKEHTDFMLGLFKDSDYPADLGMHDYNVFATHLTHGDRTAFPMGNFSEELPNNWYSSLEVGQEANNEICLIAGEPVEVGPRARAVKFKGFTQKGAMGIQIARVRENQTSVHRAENILDELNTSGTTKVRVAGEGDGKLGIGINEAARGSNVHMARVNEGRIRYYNCLVPTMWNYPTISTALEGDHYKYAEVIVRAYDPCNSCATHMIVLDPEKKVIENKLI